MFRIALVLLASYSLLAAAPEAKIAPWLTADGASAHDTFAHRDITLKGTSSEAGDHIQATWEFGDGSAPITFAVAKGYDVSAKHAYFGTPGDLFEARLTLTNTRTGESSTAAYQVAMREQSPAVEINIAIDEGLWRRHVAMHEGQSSELDRMAFETHGHSADGPSADAYTATLAAIKQARANRAARASTLPFAEQYAIAALQNADGSWSTDSATALISMAKTPVSRELGINSVLNVSSSVTATTSSILYNRLTNTYNMTLTVKNTGVNPIAGPINVGITGLTAGITLANATGTFNGAPYIFLTVSTLAPNAQAAVQLRFANPGALAINFGRVTYSGTFPPAALTIACPANTATIGSPYSSAIDANGGVLNYVFSISPGSLPSPLVLNPATGAITGTPSSSGLANFTVNVTDGAGPTQQTANASCSINVTGGNAAPTANAQSPSIQEDTPTNIILTGSDPETSPLTFSIVTGPSNGTLGAIIPINATSASVQYTPGLNYNGSDSFTFKVNDGSLDSPAATVSINVTAVNDPPTFAIGTPPTIFEDSGAQTVGGLASSISPGPANESGQTVSFNVTGNSNPGLFNAGPSIAPNGTLTYTPAANAFGSATITVTATDDGAPPATSPSQQFTITVTAVNDVPSFVPGANQTVNEDAGAQSVAWATAINKGAANESAQVIDFIVSNNNSGLFSTQPVVSATGVLTYTPAANVSGVATVSVQIHDDGGTANGGVDTSAVQQFTITVNAINDAPSFTIGTPPAILEDAGAQTVPGFATAISHGPADESGQTVSFNITGNTNAALFSVLPSIDSNGQLTYTPAADANGTATITVTASDDGVPPATSPSQQFTITVTAVNDVPSFTPGAHQTVNEDAAAQNVAWATAINKGAANESGQAVNFIVSNNNNTLFSSQPAISAAGQLTYTPAANQNGVATVTVQIHDDGGTANGGVDTSASVQFTITVTAVNDAPTVSNKNYNAQAGMAIDIGAGVGLLTGVADAADNGVNGCVSTAFSVGAISATSPVGGSVVANPDGSFRFTPPPGVTGNVTFTYTVTDTGCPAPAATSAAATVTFSVAGPAIWFVAPNNAGNGNGNMDNPFNNLASATAAMGANANHRIFVFHSGGAGNATSTASGTNVTLNAAGSQWLSGQGAVAASFDALMGITPPLGTIARPAINGVRPAILGTITMNGNNSTVRGVSITPPASSQGLVATNATSISVSDATVTTSNATAVNFNGTGNGTITLISVNATGGGNGIILHNFNSASGSFSVLGDGSNVSVGGNNTGGTISGMSGADVGTQTVPFPGVGIYLNNTRNVILRRITVNGTNQNYGIRGFAVNVFMLEYSTVSGTNGTTTGTLGGDNLGEASLYFGNIATNGIVTAANFTNNSLSGGRGRNLGIHVTSGAPTITIKGNTFGLTQSVTGDQSLFVETRNSGTNASVVVGGTNAGEPNTFTGSSGDLANFTGQQQSTMDVVFRNNVMSNSHPNNNIGGGSLVLATAGTMTFHVTGNTMRDANGSAVTLFKASATLGTPSMSGFFSGNTIGVAGVANSGSASGNGIFVSAAGTGTMSYTITNNTINQIAGNGHIYADNTGGSYTANFTITGNTLGTPGAGWFAGIAVTNGSPTSGDTINVCAKIGGATVPEKNTLNLGGNLGVIVGSSGAAAGHTFNLPGYAGGASAANIKTFLSGNNSGAFTTDAYADAPATLAAFTGTGVSCPTPTN